MTLRRSSRNTQPKKYELSTDYDSDSSSFTESDISMESSSEDEVIAEKSPQPEAESYPMEEIIQDNDSDSTVNDVPSSSSVKKPRNIKKVLVKHMPKQEDPIESYYKPPPKQEIKTFEEYHPEVENVWENLQEEVDNMVVASDAQQPEKLMVKLLPFQLQGLRWMISQEESKFKGGILADEMGMGKTIQMISLILSKPVKQNLIICPTVALMQWYSELTNRTASGSLNVLIFHGQDRERNLNQIKTFDVVITTYSIIESGYRLQTTGKKRNGQVVKVPSLLHSIKWDRIVLDEAHAIKDRSSSTARSVFALERQYAWSMSGTPLQNRVGELYSIIRFLNVDPFSCYFCRYCDCSQTFWNFTGITCNQCGHRSYQHFCWWNAEILKPIQKYGTAGEGRVAFDRLRLLLDRIMLRRTKVEKSKELGLPPRIVECRYDVFNAAENEVYESLYSDTVRTFNTYVRSGTVLNNYASIFSLLSRMRLAANHPDLVTCKIEKNSFNFVCAVCFEEAEDPIQAQSCHHYFCRQDARQYIQSCPENEEPRCPTCFKVLNIDLTQNTIERPENIKSSSIVNYIDLANWRSSTKIEALVEELTKLQRQDCTIKSLVFSQFVAFLDLIQWRLSRAGFQVVKLDGRMGPKEREVIISKFMTDPLVTVFLVSLKAGGVGINLTEASQVFIVDPWWNPAVEDQAFDRIHRFGQHRPIRITRLIIENSIESRILELQVKKKALFDSTVGKNSEALARLSEDDLKFLFTL